MRERDFILGSREEDEYALEKLQYWFKSVTIFSIFVLIPLLIGRIVQPEGVMSGFALLFGPVLMVRQYIAYFMDYKDYSKAEIQLHVAVQMLSLTGINFVPHQSDDSHTTSRWDAESARLSGRSFELNGHKYRVFLDIRGFELGLEKDGVVTTSFPLDGLGYKDTLAAWQKWFTDAGYTGNYVLELHYDLPGTEAYQFEQFDKPSADILNHWVELRTRANRALFLLTTEVDLPSEVNIWPHHFDTGVYFVLHETDGTVDRSIGAGLAVADTVVSEPYFYIYGWGKEQKIDYSNAPDLPGGRWITGAFEGAVLPVSAALTTSDVDTFFVVAAKFLRHSLNSE